ncbi:MAG: hypothetical protein H6556_00780 [Lewinellaceae bacterium]|nr:hypothetical protein [Lewinellaceae bacterium]
MRILFLSIMAILALQYSGQSQSLKEVLEAGDASFQSRDYYNAYRCYETILKYAAQGAYKEDTLSVKFRYAQVLTAAQLFLQTNALYGELSRHTGV